MFTSWRIGRIFGVPVEINLSFLLIALVLVATSVSVLAGVLLVVVLFGSVLLHEAGHALVARRLGVYVSGIELSFFGGAAKMTQMPRSADHEIAIAAAGPAVSLILAGAGFGLGAVLQAPLIASIGFINLVLAGFNLIPALPMDGGRILRALLTRRMDFVRATDIAVTVSRVAAIGFGLFGLLAANYWLVMLAPMLWMMGTRERMLARAMADQYAGHGRGGVDVFRRGAGPFDRSSSFGGGSDPFDSPDDRRWRGGAPRSHDGGPAVRRFTIRQVGGRLVVETLD
jgi:Zn-dependent protease